jgi:hypothetical protein
MRLCPVSLCGLIIISILNNLMRPLLALCSVPFALCPMPHAPCPLPSALCPLLFAKPEKNDNLLRLNQ